MWLACVFAFIIRTPLHEYIQNLLEDREEIGNLYKQVGVVAGGTAAMMLSCVIEFLAVRNTDSINIQDYRQHLEPLESSCQTMQS